MPKSKYKDLRAHTRGDKDDPRKEKAPKPDEGADARRPGKPSLGAGSVQAGQGAGAESAETPGQPDSDDITGGVPQDDAGQPGGDDAALAGSPVKGVPGKKKSASSAGGPGAAKGKKSATHPDEVLKGLNVPQQFMPGFIGAVKSCMQFVTDAKTHQYFLHQLQGPGPIAQKLSEGVYALLQIVFHQANGAMPPQTIIPVGVYMISWVADYVKRAGLAKLVDNDIGTAMQMFLHDVVTKAQNAGQKRGILGGGMPQRQGQPGAPGQAPPQPGPALPKMKAPQAQAPGAQPNMGPGAAPGPQMTQMPGMGGQ